MTYLINQNLYSALSCFFDQLEEVGGAMRTGGSNAPDYIRQTLEEISIKYFGNDPETDDEIELANDGTPMLTDRQAFDLMLERFNNTTVICNRQEKILEKQTAIDKLKTKIARSTGREVYNMSKNLLVLERDLELLKDN